MQISRFCGYENFLWNLRAWHLLMATASNARKFSLRKSFFHQFANVFSHESSTIWCYCFCLNATYLILHLNNLHSFSVQVHHYHSTCITLLSFPSSSSFASSSLSIFRPNYCSPSLLSASPFLFSGTPSLLPSIYSSSLLPSITQFTISPSLLPSSFYPPSLPYNIL